jgi:arylsulfatase A-like enzyme
MKTMKRGGGWAWLFWAAGIVIGCAIGGCRQATRLPRPAHIIIVVVDALRPDHLGCNGYAGDISPNIDGLARRGAVFENAYSNAPWTKPSVASLFTSLYPNVHRAIDRFDTLSEKALTLAERLKTKGYFTAFINGGNALLHGFNYDQGFDFYDYSESLDSAAAVRAFASLLEQTAEKRCFFYVHLMDTHLPYYPNELSAKLGPALPRDSPSGMLDRDRIRDLTSEGKLTEEDKKTLVSLYDHQITAADRSVGALVSALESRGWLQDTLLLLTSDHGEEFWDHGNYEHGHSLYDEILRVPLIILGPGVPAVRLKSRVRHIDILPTIMESVEPKFKTAGLAGRSFSSYLKRDKGKRPVFATGTIHGDEKYCLIQGDRKIVINTGYREKKRKLVGPHSAEAIELYDLNLDPREQKNLRLMERKRLGRLMRRIARLMNATPAFQAGKKAIDKQTEERLRSLGYL